MTSADEERVRFSVLLVCRANICRSPTAQLILSRALAANGIADSVTVASAGVVAEPGQPWCEVAAGKVSDGVDRALMHEQHKSRQLDRAMIEAADLVLTATRSERAAAVHLSPTATVRIFTLKEAAVLAGAVADSLTPPGRGDGSNHKSEGAFVAEPLPLDSPPQDRLRWLTSEMHNARGLVRMPEDGEQRVGVLRRRRRRTSGVDIPDPHGGERVRHSPSQLSEAVRAWADAATLAIRDGEAQD